MPRRPTRTAPTVILHGWQGSTGDHWQVWLADQLRSAGREVRFPQLPDADLPDLDAWLEALNDTISDLPPDGYDVVAHSLSLDPLAASRGPHTALTATRNELRSSHRSRRTPRSPSLQSFFPVPLDIDQVRRGADGTVLIAGDNDPYTPEGIADAYGRPLKIPTTVIAGGGHINVESGYGPWPAMLDWCGRDNLAFF